MACEVGVPLDDNKQVHVSKHGPQQNNLGQEDVPEVVLPTEVPLVCCLLHESQRHVTHAEDNTHLHLERVQIRDFLTRLHPSRVHSHRIDTRSRVDIRSECSLPALDVVARAEQVEWDAGEIVVKQATVHCEKAHEQKQVPALIHWVVWFLGRKMTVCEHEQCA